MRWLDRAIIIGDKEPFDAQKIAAVGVRTVYIEGCRVKDGSAQQQVAQAKAAGLNAGLIEAPLWYSMSPSAFAHLVHDHLVACGLGQSYWQPSLQQGAPVMLDLEPDITYGGQWAADMTTAYHALMPVRETCVTTEAWKGDGRIFPTDQWAALGWHWYPMLYDDQMYQLPDPAGIVLDAARALHSADRAHGMYDAKFPVEMVRDGCLFTIGRLP